MKSKITSFFTVLLCFCALGIWLYPKFKGNPRLDQLNELNTFYQNELVGRSVNFPQNLLPINVNEKLNQLVKDQDKYLLTVIDADCGECMSDLKKWDKYLSETQGVSAIFVLTGSDKYNVDFLINDQIHFEYPVYLDRLDEFSNLNDVSAFKSFRTFHIEGGVIKKVGSPLLLDGLID